MVLHGLKAEQFNGKIGVIESKKEDGRFQIKLEDGQIKKIKVENIKEYE